ncbi:hypothetical protein V9T40_010685 [Parthenolecanium corni]|uniref:Uncharacterized protein n=1 Tax=Parthenolecanium corni TaxID=536013 RepID=A0AAN9XXV8_9HEMI
MNLLKIFTYGGIIEVFVVPHILPCVSGFIPGYVNDMIQLGISLISSFFPHVTINVQSEVFFKVWKDLEDATKELNRTYSTLPDIQSDLDSRSSSGSFPCHESSGRSDFAKSEGRDSASASSGFPKSSSCQPCQPGNSSKIGGSTTPKSGSAFFPESTPTSDAFPESNSCNPCKFENSSKTKNAATTPMPSSTFPASNCCLPFQPGHSSEVRKSNTTSSAVFPKSTANNGTSPDSKSCNACKFDDSSETKNIPTAISTFPKSNSCSSCQPGNLNTSTKSSITEQPPAKTDGGKNTNDDDNDDICQRSAKYLTVTRTTFETCDTQSEPASKSTGNTITSLLLGRNDMFAQSWPDNSLINPTNRRLRHENGKMHFLFYEFEKGEIGES